MNPSQTRHPQEPLGTDEARDAVTTPPSAKRHSRGGPTVLTTLRGRRARRAMPAHAPPFGSSNTATLTPTAPAPTADTNNTNGTKQQTTSTTSWTLPTNPQKRCPAHNPKIAATRSFLLMMGHGWPGAGQNDLDTQSITYISD